MKITKARRPGEQIVLNLLKPSTLSQDGWVTPISFETVSPPQTYARVPHGPFAVRVLASAPVEVVVEFEGEKVLETVLDKGAHILQRGDDGKSFIFAAECHAPAATPAPTLFPELEEPAPVQTNGLVRLQARFVDIGTPRPDLTPDYPVSAFFQMVTPEQHGEVTAGLLMKMKKPDEIPSCDDHLVNPAGAPSTATPRVKRFCATCGSEH